MTDCVIVSKKLWKLSKQASSITSFGFIKFCSMMPKTIVLIQKNYLFQNNYAGWYLIFSWLG